MISNESTRLRFWASRGLLLVVMVGFSLVLIREWQFASAEGAAAALLNLRPEEHSLPPEQMERIDNQLRRSLFDMAPLLNYSIGPRYSYMVPARIVKYFDSHRGGKLLFPEPSPYNSRMASFAEEIRNHPGGRSVSYLVPWGIGIGCVALLGVIVFSRRKRTGQRIGMS
ncbi:MAG: hypothetical protein WCP86_01475 [bacterium]